MRTREKKLSDYGISPDRAQELLLLARQEQNRNLLRRAADRRCWLLEHLFMGVHSGDKGGYLWIPSKNTCRFQ